MGILDGAQGPYTVRTTLRRHHPVNIGFPLQCKISGFWEPGCDEDVTLHEMNGYGSAILGVGGSRDEYWEL